MLPGIGVFGTGSIVNIIIPFLSEKGFKIEAIWGYRNADVLEVATKFAIPFYTRRIDDVLLRKEVDLIFIMCSPRLHAEIAVKALGIGKHVVCDKPGGLSQVEALKMVRAAQYYPSLISVINYSLRFLPATIKVKKAIEDGFLGGPIKVIDVRVQMGPLLNEGYDSLCDESMGGGILARVGSHVIDLVHHLTGQRASRVHAVIRTLTQTTKNINGIRRVTAPDFCTLQMELNSGTLVIATLSNHLKSQSSHEIIISGPQAHLVIREGNLHGFREEEEEEKVLFVDDDNLQDFCLSFADSIPRPYIKGLRKMIGALKEAFISVEDKKGWIKEPVLSAATFEDGLYVQAVIDALRQSNKRREWTKVVILAEEPDPNPLLSAAVRATAISI